MQDKENMSDLTEMSNNIEFAKVDIKWDQNKDFTFSLIVRRNYQDNVTEDKGNDISQGKKGQI